MQETLQEFVDSRGVAMRVDREAGVIRGVKILGLESRNGRSYLPEALLQAAPLYEGAKVNVNHPKGSPTGPRDYQDRIGAIRNVVPRSGAGLFGDFHFNPKHALAEQLLWDAEHAPENVGFSHNVEARTSRNGDRVVVEAITKVQSVDLVADPATTRGLYEGQQPAAQTPTVCPLAEVTAEELKRERPDLVEAIAADAAAELVRLRSELDRLEAADRQHRRQEQIRSLLREFKLPDPETAEGRDRAIVGRRFLETLLAAPDEKAIRDLVEERAGLVRDLDASATGAAGGARPQSREQNTIEPPPQDAKSFIEAIT